MTTTAATTVQLPSGTWTIDASHTEVGFVARHLMVSKVRGTFREVSGTVEVAEDVTQSSVEVAAQIASVETGSPDRDTHLKSADFFDAEQFPAMTFRSTSFDGATLAGDLTIKDVTKPVTFDVEFGGVGQDPWGNTKAGFEATTTVNRKDWGLTWNAAVEGGGVLVSDKITITIDVQLAKQA
ncbi:YceI family protein [Knoellia aerolata]|uniref:Polyisoprenoid-binding protein n=1 Tax=Knoellia aerolata DSM 18566 TaxID=1385519 RepID=A0A0A0K1N7_9MICO|nr:YceI family protein [Knoellia aerolata]KGN42909.1 polyisoprenoid-binding protein [Knoellia aerolata DSM 18566]